MHSVDLTAVSVLAAETGYSPYDAGVRHIATLAGYLCFGLMAMTVCFGILTTTGWVRRSIERRTLAGGHMLLAVITLSFGAIHAIAYAFQTSEHFTYLMVVVPFVGGGEPEVAMGIIGLELALAIAVSIWVQKRLGYRRWHLLHYLAYPAFALSVAHTVATSPEVRSLGGVGLIVVAATAAAALLAVLRMLPAKTAVAAHLTPEEL